MTRIALAGCRGLGLFVSLLAGAWLQAAEEPRRWQGTAADYERAGALRAQTRDKVYRAHVTPQWAPDGQRFWYANRLAGGEREFVLVDAVAGKRLPAFDRERLAAALTQASSQPPLPARLPVDRLEFRPDGLHALLKAAGKTWDVQLSTYAVREEQPGAAPAVVLPADRRQRPTRHTGPETSLTFENRTGKAVKLFWMDPGGRRHAYGTLQPDEESEQSTYEGHVWLVTDLAGTPLGVYEATATATTVAIGAAPAAVPPPPAPAAAPAPPRAAATNRWEAFIRQHNVWLRDRTTGKAEALTRDGTADDAYHDPLRWSSDATHLVALRTRAGEDHKLYRVESSPDDQVQPRLHTTTYLKPGDRIAVTRPYLFDAAAGREIPLADTLFPNPWSIEDVRWEPDGRRFTFLYNQRGHQVLRIVAVEAATGRAEALVDEQSKTFIDYSGKSFVRYLDATGEILWMSERDGWNHLYLYDARTGAVKNAVTQGAWAVHGVDRVDTQRREIWFRAGGLDPKQDPYHVHYARVRFDGTGLVRLTEGDGTHALTYSPVGRFYLDRYSRVDLPPVTELRRTEDGRLVCELERADASALLATGWLPPERFAAKGRDGQTDIYGIIVRPLGFDPNRRYPVIEHIYAGPQEAFVPKTWAACYAVQELAELGFVVVVIDGMGTSFRSKAFHDVCWKNIGDAGFPDRIAWLRAAAGTRPWMDLARIGIYGTSAGGQNALRALLAHPDFYKAAVADSGCHDNRMDKIWWNEQWMGWPVGPHYAEQSNVTQAHKLQGKLLLIVGEMDDNVDPASTLQVANALIRADKDFELLVVPGEGHGTGESPYGRRRRSDFFVRHLLGTEPRGRL